MSKHTHFLLYAWVVAFTVACAVTSKTIIEKLDYLADRISHVDYMGTESRERINLAWDDIRAGRCRCGDTRK